MIHRKKIYPEYFEPLIEGKKPFEIRKNDEDYKPGEKVLFSEYLGSVQVPICPDLELCHKNNLDYDPFKEQECLNVPSECIRGQCTGYTKELYTGRDCLVKIKDLFDLTKAGLPGYVAFTFDILNIRNKSESKKLNRQEVRDYFKDMRSTLIAEDFCDKRSEDSIYYEAIELTAAAFNISEAEVYDCLNVKYTYFKFTDKNGVVLYGEINADREKISFAKLKDLLHAETLEEVTRKEYEEKTEPD